MSKIEAKHINYALLAITAFLIPLYQPLVRFAIGFLTLSTFFHFRKEVKDIVKLSPLLLYFVWLLVGQLWTDNLDAGWKEIEYSLSFLIFPLIFWFSKMEIKNYISRIFSFFTFGYVVSMAICLILGIYNYVTTGDLQAFYYADLSFFHHPSYMAMYGCASLIYLYYSILNEEQVKTYYFKTQLSKFALIATISLFVLLLMSKAGIIFMLLVNTIGILAVFSSRQKLKQAFMVLGGLSLIMTGAYLTITPLQERVDEAWVSLTSNSASESSTGARILVWDASWQIIQDAPLTGVGTGDLSNELDKIYETEHHAKLLEKSLNSHNQFLESWGKSGLVGLLSIFGLFIYAFKKRENKFYLYFVLLIGLNMLMESMLQIQSGIVFIAFMNSMFAVALIRDQK
jgi:O-antigen ligase